MANFRVKATGCTGGTRRLSNFRARAGGTYSKKVHCTRCRHATRENCESITRQRSHSKIRTSNAESSSTPRSCGRVENVYSGQSSVLSISTGEHRERIIRQGRGCKSPPSDAKNSSGPDAAVCIVYVDRGSSCPITCSATSEYCESKKRQ